MNDYEILVEAFRTEGLQYVRSLGELITPLIKSREIDIMIATTVIMYLLVIEPFMTALKLISFFVGMHVVSIYMKNDDELIHHIATLDGTMIMLVMSMSMLCAILVTIPFLDALKIIALSMGAGVVHIYTGYDFETVTHLIRGN